MSGACAPVAAAMPTRRRVRGRSDVEHFDFWYGKTQALLDIDLSIAPRAVTALIGPSGCGKSTFLRSINRLNELIPGRASHGGDPARRRGHLPDAGWTSCTLRQRVGMVFQRWNPFPKSIYDNVAYGPRINRRAVARGARRDRRVGAAARRAVGRGEGPAARERTRRSPAASSSGSASRGRWPTIPRSCCSTSRRPRSIPIATQKIEELRLRAQARAHDRHRHAQPAAGGARLRPHGLLLPRHARRDGETRSDCSPARARSAPRPTSPGDSDEPRRIPFRHFHDQLAALKRRLLDDVGARGGARRTLRRRAARARRRARREAVIAADRELDAHGARDRGSGARAARAAAADGARPPLHRQRDQGHERPRAGRRSRRQHRPGARSGSSPARDASRPTPRSRTWRGARAPC